MERRIRVQIAYNRVRGARSRTARREEKRSEEEGRGGEGVPGGCSSPATGPAKTWRRAAPHAQPSPPGNRAREVGER